MKIFKFNNLLLFLVIGLTALSSCSEEKDEVLVAKANFEAKLVMVGDEAIVKLHNKSENATSFKWSSPKGTPEISEEENPEIAYKANGTYPIDLEVFNGTFFDKKTIQILIDGIDVNNGDEGNEEENTDDENADDATDGKGEIVTRKLTLDSFSGVDLNVRSDVRIKQGDRQEVTVVGHENVVQSLQTIVANDIWKIEFEKDHYFKNYELTIEITIPKVNKTEVNGSGNIHIYNFENQEKLLSVNVNGGGNITLQKFEGITELDVSLNGGGSFEAKEDISTLNDLEINNMGSAKYLGFALSSDQLTVSTMSSGKCELTANKTLDATILGSGNIYYKGTPEITQNKIGSGRLIQAN